MILTVTLNAAIDKRYVVKRMDCGTVMRVKECTYVPGGKGLNVSKPAVLAGADVLATGFLGGHAGKYIEDALKDFNLSNDFYYVPGESRSCINIWDEEQGIQTELLEPGLSISVDQFEEFKAHFKKLLAGADTVTMSGSVPSGLADDTYRQLVEIVKGEGKKVILDTSGNLLEAGMKARPTLIKPNIDEIKMLTGQDCNTIEECIGAAKRIHCSGIEIVVVSLGGDGSVLVCKEGVFRGIVPRVEAVNTVGCGDSMIAGFAIGLDQGMTIPDTYKYACAISAASAMHEETGRFHQKDFEKMMEQVKIEQIVEV